MKNKYKASFLFILFPLLISCVPASSPEATSSSSSEEISITSETTIKEDIYNMGYTNISVNGETYYQVAEGLYANKTPGLYKFNFKLKFAYNDEIDSLYYNYQGEKPVKNSLCYLAPFEEIEVYENIPEGNDEIPLTTSVDEILKNYNDRCVSYNYINNVQNPQKYSYFNNAFVVDITFVHGGKDNNFSMTYLIDNSHEYTLPLVFLSMPYRKWFGSPYYFYNNIYEEIDQRVVLEFYDPVTEDYWWRNSKIKLGGGWSKGYPQRTLNLNFKKDEYDNKNEKVESPIFGDRNICSNPNKALSKHIRFRLHNGGNCFEQWSGFNDAILQRAMYGTNTATTAYRPCLVYLNGEYWGLMSLREHYSDYYIKQNYGVDDDNVTMFELKGDLIFDDGDENGLVYINELKALLNDSRFNSNEAKVEEAYQELCSKIDVDSFIDLLVAEYYCCNWDFVGNMNNLKMWRAMTTSDKKYEDGKWRFCLHDADFAFSENTNFLNKNVNNSFNNWSLVRCLMSSKTFRNKLISRAEELVNSNLSSKNLSDITIKMYDEVRPYKKDSGKRWGQPASYYADWQNYYSYLLSYYQNRSNSLVNELKTVINNQYGGY